MGLPESTGRASGAYPFVFGAARLCVGLKTSFDRSRGFPKWGGKKGAGERGQRASASGHHGGKPARFLESHSVRPLCLEGMEVALAHAVCVSLDNLQFSNACFLAERAYAEKPCEVTKELLATSYLHCGADERAFSVLTSASSEKNK